MAMYSGFFKSLLFRKTWNICETSSL